jgi:hypothetical protein
MWVKCSYTILLPSHHFFSNYTIHQRYAQRTHTHPYEYTHANLTLGASSKTVPANPQDWRRHHRRLAVDGNVAYHWKHKRRRIIFRYPQLLAKIGLNDFSMIWHIGPAAHAVTAVVDAPCVLEGVKLGADNSWNAYACAAWDIRRFNHHHQ